MALSTADMVMVPSASPIQVTSVLSKVATKGATRSGTVITNSLLQAAVLGELVSYIVIV